MAEFLKRQSGKVEGRFVFAGVKREATRRFQLVDDDRSSRDHYEGTKDQFTDEDLAKHSEWEAQREQWMKDTQRDMQDMRDGKGHEDGYYGA